MEQLPKQVYTNEYRQQVVLMVTRDGMSGAQVSRKLAMSQKTLANWVKRAKDGRLPATTEPGVARRIVTGAEGENLRLRREVAELRMAQPDEFTRRRNYSGTVHHRSRRFQLANDLSRRSARSRHG